MNVETIEEEFQHETAYTYKVLERLQKLYGENIDLCLIMGDDNLINLRKWKNYEEILSKYEIIVIGRNEYDKTVQSYKDIFERENNAKITLCSIINFQVSSSLIRKLIKENKMVQTLLPNKEVLNYILDNNFYK